MIECHTNELFPLISNLCAKYKLMIRLGSMRNIPKIRNKKVEFNWFDVNGSHFRRRIVIDIGV